MTDKERIDRLEWVLARLIGSLGRELGLDHAGMLLDDLCKPHVRPQLPEVTP